MPAFSGWAAMLALGRRQAFAWAQGARCGGTIAVLPKRNVSVSTKYSNPPSGVPSSDPQVRRAAAERITATFKEQMKFLKRPEFLATVASKPLTNHSAVFANHDIRFDQIDWIGFDYDYTLVKYTEHLQHLIYDLAKDRLVTKMGYPDAIKELHYDETFPIRGLIYDKKRGNLFKSNLANNVDITGVYHGRKRMRPRLAAEMYDTQSLDMHDRENFRPISDLFSFSTACLIADVIEHFNNQSIEFDPAYVFDDVVSTISYVHTTLLHEHIAQDRSKYVHSNPKLVSVLQRYRDAGKGLFLLSNSPIAVVDRGMDYLIKGSPEAENGFKSWADLFDIIITSSDKPNFYNSERPFREIDNKTYSLTWDKVTMFKKGRFYAHGSLKEMQRIMPSCSSRRTLYFGDHLYTDLIGPARAGWRTAVIIKEMEQDIKTQNTVEYRRLCFKEETIQDLIREVLLECNPFVDEDARVLWDMLRKERLLVRMRKKEMFNKHFGSIFSTPNSKTTFAFNMLRYTDLYTSKIENLLNYPALMAFYPQRWWSPHEFRADSIAHDKK